MVRPEKGSPCIDAVHQVVFLHRRMFGACQVNGAGIVDEDVDASKMLNRRLHCLLHLLLISNVDLTWQALSTRFLH